MENLNEVLNNLHVSYEHKFSKCSDVFIIGGEEIYRRAIVEYDIKNYYITEVYKNAKKNDDDSIDFSLSLKKV